MKRDDINHPHCTFINDIRWLSYYNVRKGYKKYGAAAYFNRKWELLQIYVSHNDKLYSRNNCTSQEWSHAKWVWKVCTMR